MICKKGPKLNCNLGHNSWKSSTRQCDAVSDVWLLYPHFKKDCMMIALTWNMITANTMGISLYYISRLSGFWNICALGTICVRRAQGTERGIGFGIGFVVVQHFPTFKNHIKENNRVLHRFGMFYLGCGSNDPFP